MRFDIDFNFGIHPLTGDLATKRSSGAIRQAIKNIVLTSFYERGFNIEFGTNLRSSLFENITQLTIQTMKDFIQEGIRNFEPHVELVDVVMQRGSNENTVYATIIYTEYNNPIEQSIIVELERLQ